MRTRTVILIGVVMFGALIGVYALAFGSRPVGAVQPIIATDHGMLSSFPRYELFLPAFGAGVESSARFVAPTSDQPMFTLLVVGQSREMAEAWASRTSARCLLTLSDDTGNSVLSFDRPFSAFTVGDDRRGTAVYHAEMFRPRLVAGREYSIRCVFAGKDEPTILLVPTIYGGGIELP
jgi:hypothetical protein